MQCDRCSGKQFTKAGRDRYERQLYRCHSCSRRMTERSSSAFSGYRFPNEVISLAVRWYLLSKLSYADVADLLAQRGIPVDPSTIYDWVQVFTQRIAHTAPVCHSPFGMPSRVDETYIKIDARWVYLYRAADKHGQIVDVYLSDHRNAAAANEFFERTAAASGVTPIRVTADKSKAYQPAVEAVLPEAQNRKPRYLNNGGEWEHRRLPGAIRSTHRFTKFASATTLYREHVSSGSMARGHSALRPEVPSCQRLAAESAALNALL